MCGISGIIKKVGDSVTKEEILNLSSIMAHRGPDHLGYYIDGNTALAHNRLSILDLSDSANQPFEDDSDVLIFNGEIYNFKELKQHTPDVIYKTHGDTEVLFYLLKIHGIEKALTLLEGMFAFAWYQKSSKKLTIARDRLGIKPLYYTNYHNGFYFSSEVKAIANHLPIPLNHNTVLDSFYGGGESHRYKTLFEKVYSLQPGHFSVITNGVLEKQICYYNLYDEFNPDLYYNNCLKKRDTFQNEFNELIADSIKKLMVTDAPVATMASGGIDSSVITYFAAQNQKIDVFTADVADYKSELPDVKLLTEQLKLKLHICTFHNPDYLEHITKTIWHFDAPIISYSNSVPFAMTAGLARENNIKVVLTGEGSDELFLGYPKFHAHKVINKAIIPYKIISSLYNKMPGLSGYLNQRDPSGSDILVHFLNRNFDRQETRSSFQKKFQGKNKTEGDYVFSTLNYLSEHLVGILYRNDRMGMMHSIEARFPFLSEKLIHFGLHVPYKYKFQYIPKFYNKKHPFILDKSLVRNSVKGILPDSLVFKNKWGFGQNAPALVKYKPGAFSTGYLAEVLDMDARAEQYFMENFSPYVKSKIFAMEIFGRMFGLKHSVEETNEWVKRVAYF